MYKGPVTTDLIKLSVVSVPPLCMTEGFEPDPIENARLVDRLVARGVTTVLYGGNANLGNFPPHRFAALLETLAGLGDDDSWIVPSVGPDFGKSGDQLIECRNAGFPTAMVLPTRESRSASGFATGFRKLAEGFGAPLIAYIKYTGAISPQDLGALASDGLIANIKYAVEGQPDDDPYLADIIQNIGNDLVVSGIGELPASKHLRSYPLPSFTSGSVCVAPGLSAKLLKALQAGNESEINRITPLFEPLEMLRFNNAPASVLHTAVEAVGIAKTGPILPYLSLDHSAELDRALRAAAQTLFEAEEAEFA